MSKVHLFQLILFQEILPTRVKDHLARFRAGSFSAKLGVITKLRTNVLRGSFAERGAIPLPDDQERLGSQQRKLIENRLREDHIRGQSGVPRHDRKVKVL